MYTKYSWTWISTINLEKSKIDKQIFEIKFMYFMLLQHLFLWKLLDPGQLERLDGHPLQYDLEPFVSCKACQSYLPSDAYILEFLFVFDACINFQKMKKIRFSFGD